MTVHSTGSPGKHRIADETINFAEASPLLREVEQAHAQLQAAFKEPGADRRGDSAIDLAERVRRLEASFNAISQNRPISGG